MNERGIFCGFEENQSDSVLGAAMFVAAHPGKKIMSIDLFSPQLLCGLM